MYVKIATYSAFVPAKKKRPAEPAQLQTTYFMSRRTGAIIPAERVITALLLKSSAKCCPEPLAAAIPGAVTVEANSGQCCRGGRRMVQ
jgi:hypothetical protein